MFTSEDLSILQTHRLDRFCNRFNLDLARFLFCLTEGNQELMIVCLNTSDLDRLVSKEPHLTYYIGLILGIPTVTLYFGGDGGILWQNSFNLAKQQINEVKFVTTSSILKAQTFMMQTLNQLEPLAQERPAETSPMPQAFVDIETVAKQVALVMHRDTTDVTQDLLARRFPMFIEVNSAKQFFQLQIEQLQHMMAELDQPTMSATASKPTRSKRSSAKTGKKAAP